jgi:RimJ/RimL family protein N-acetyltransferase
MRLPAAVEESDFVVRLWRPLDARALHQAVVESTEHLRPWMWWIAHEPFTVPQRRSLIEEWEQSWEAGGAVPMGIFLRGTVVGGSGYVNPKEGSLEIGYWTHVRHLRQGHAAHAARLLTSTALSLPGISRVEIHHDKANVRSSGVPRRLGYRFVGEQPDEIRAPAEIGIDCGWVVDRREWARLLARES